MATTDRTHAEQQRAQLRSIFDRILVAIDGSDSGFEACRQAARLATPDATLEAVAVVHLADAVYAGFDASRAADELQRDAEASLRQAGRILGRHAQQRFVNGFVTPSLLRERERIDATLIALGSHGHSRVTEILLGGVAGEILHDAPCSVLVARPAPEPARFPRTIVVGTDGSEPAGAALSAANELAARLAVPLRVVTALQGKGVHPDLVRHRSPEVEVIDAHPVDALVEASPDADLVVVGSRGLHGLRALGSVCERVAHHAACSVLVVRWV